MPRFFFDHFDGQRLDRDEDGLEFPNVETAYLQAFEAAVEMWAEALHERRNPSRDWFKIKDVKGHVVFELPFAEIVESGKGSLPKRPTTVANLLANAKRAQVLQQDLQAQIAEALRRLDLSRELLARF